MLINKLKNIDIPKNKVHTQISKLKSSNQTASCLVCGVNENLYRLTISKLGGESTFFMLLCHECAQEIAHSILTIKNIT